MKTYVANWKVCLVSVRLHEYVLPLCGNMCVRVLETLNLCGHACRSNPYNFNTFTIKQFQEQLQQYSQGYLKAV